MTTTSIQESVNVSRQRDAILLIGSGDQLYREYVCAAIAPSHRLVLLESAPASWQRRYVADAVHVDLNDADAVLTAAQDCSRDHNLRAVLTYDETRVRLAAEVAAHLGLPHLDRGAAERCRDKLASRQALLGGGVPSARAHHVSTLAAAGAAAGEIGYPVVLKPRALAGSIGVTRVDSAGELPAAFSLACDAQLEGVTPLDGVLVEEFLQGPEISIDCAVLDGRVEIMALARKRSSFAPFFEEVGHVVTAAEDRLLPLKQIGEVVTSAHHALGIDRGVTHTEVRLTPTGPRIVEVNARLGGDLIPYLAGLATGIDLALAAAEISVGNWPSLQPKRSRAAAIRFFYPHADIRVLDVRLDPAWRVPPWLDRLAWEAAEGDVLQLPPRGFLSRLGFAIVTGSNEAECEARLDVVQSHVRVTSEPLSPADVVPTAQALSA
jgi:carbamoylphosphate synthase large subunit